MKEEKLYYVTPSDSEFEEVKNKAMELWSTKGAEPTYSKEKIDHIKGIKNIGDNFMHLVAMFDEGNIITLSSMLSPETRKAVKERMISVNSPAFIHFE